MQRNEGLEKEVAKEYVQRWMYDRHAPATEHGECCEIVSDQHLSKHQRGLYHMALTNRVNRAALVHAIEDELRARRPTPMRPVSNVA